MAGVSAEAQLDYYNAKCPACGSSDTIIDHRQGRTICQDCGMVLENSYISEESEWRTFADSDKGGPDPNRVGSKGNALLGDIELGTGIVGGMDGMADLNMTHDRTMASSDRALLRAFGKIKTGGTDLNMPKAVIQTAQEIFKNVHDSREIRGRSTEILTTTCLYIASKVENCERGLKEICNVLEVKRRDVGRVYLKIMKLKKTGKLKMRSKKRRTGPLALNHIARICGSLDLPPRILQTAEKVATKYEDVKDTSETPASIAAGCVYLCCRLSEPDFHRSFEQVADAAMIGPDTVRSSYNKRIFPRREDLIPATFAPANVVRTMVP